MWQTKAVPHFMGDEAELTEPRVLMNDQHAVIGGAVITAEVLNYQHRTKSGKVDTVGTRRV
ncbi:MAG: hypothetical protein HY666_06780 [Chloroflexi bacterium]|nr:hypothetical protein [Chloroflexota bacterium]